MKIACPHCSQHIDLDPSSSGRFVSCPTCSGLIDIPRHDPNPTLAQAVSHEAQARRRPLNKIARGLFMVVGAISLFLFSKIVATAIVGTSINERIRSRVAAAADNRDNAPHPIGAPKLDSGVGVSGLPKPRTWLEIEGDPTYLSLTWVDKLKVLDRWVERVLQYGRDNGASSMDSTAAKLRSFRAEKAKEISAAARSSR